MVAMYALGSVAAAPFVPFVVDKLGRRYSILLGGVISMVGGILQGSALNCEYLYASRLEVAFHLEPDSCDVYRCSFYPRNVQCLVHRSCLFFDWRYGKVNLIRVLVINLCEELSHPKERAVMGSLFSSSFHIGKLKWWSSAGFLS
jgi:MFS family permease